MPHPIYVKAAARDWVSVADTATLVRGALASAFPGVKFYVRSESYAGGASINVWYDGLAGYVPLSSCYCADGPTPRFHGSNQCATCGYWKPLAPIYKDGMPSSADVDAVLAPFRGGDFDGMNDLKFSVRSWLNPDGSATMGHSAGSGASIPGYDFPRPMPGAVMVRFASDFIFVNTNLPYDVRAKASAA